MGGIVKQSAENPAFNDFPLPLIFTSSWWAY